MPATAPPPGLPLATALDRSEALGSLLQRLRASQARYDALAGLLPPALREGVRPGPLDDAAWVLLAPHAAAAAKLRQMLPTLQAALQSAGWDGPPIRIKVRPRA